MSSAEGRAFFVDGWEGQFEVSKTQFGELAAWGSNISNPKGTFEDHFPFLKVGYVSILEGIVYFVFVESYLSAVWLSHSVICPIFYSSPFHSNPSHTIHVYSRKVSMDHTLCYISCIYMMSICRAFYTARSILFKAAVEKKETGWVAGLVARFELVPICKEAESMIFF